MSNSISKSRRGGFTLIELLVVMIIIGILAAIAIPKFFGSRERSFIATMRSDLRNLASSQELYIGQNSTYADNLTDVGARGSDGVTMSIDEASTQGWSATATHSGAPDWTCAVYYGDAAPVAPADSEGVVACAEA